MLDPGKVIRSGIGRTPEPEYLARLVIRLHLLTPLGSVLGPDGAGARQAWLSNSAGLNRRVSGEHGATERRRWCHES